MALPVTITGISTAVACVGPYKTTAGNYVTDTGSGSSVNFGSTTGNQKAGSSFTTDANGVSAADASFWLAKSGSPTDNLTVDIYATDGSGLPTGASLGTSNTVAGSSLTGTATKTKFTFSSPVSLSASTKYAFIVSRSGSLDGSNFYTIQPGVSNDAVFAVYLQQGGTWATDSGQFGIIVNEGITTAFYFFGRDSTADTDQDLYKATDPTASFSQVDTFSFGASLGNLAGYQVSDTVHTVGHGGTGSVQSIKYYQTDLTTDDLGTVAETVAASLTTAGQTGADQHGCSIVVRSNGNAVAFFNGAQTKKSGTNYARVYWSERTGTNTWSAAAEVDAGDAFDHVYPEAVLGASDRVHFIWSRGERSLSSGNVLDTATTSIANNTSAQAVSYDSSGTIKIVDCYYTGASIAANYFDSGANPTVNSTTVTATARQPTRCFNDGTDAWAVYSKTDSDLYAKKSIDNGANWGTEVTVFSGITAGNDDISLSRDGNIYQRGSSIVIPYVVNDNGTLKYNEYVVRTSSTAWAGTAAPSITLALAANATLNMLASASLPVSFNLAANAELKPLRATVLLAIQTDLIANAIRYSPISAAPSLVTSLAANALRFTPTTSLLAVSTDLTAAAKQLMAAQSVQPVAFNMAASALRFTTALAAPQVSFDLSAATIQRLAGLATLPIELSVITAPVQRMTARAVLPVSFDLIANATIQGQAGQLIQMTAALSVALDLSANAVRYSPTTALLSVTTEMIANAVRYSPVSAAPSVVTNLAAQTTQLMAGLATLPVALDLVASAKQLMAASATLAVNFNMAANARRYTPTTALLAVELSLSASTRQRLAALSVQPIVLNMTAAPVQRMRAQATAPVVFSMSAFATIAGQVTAWAGSAVLASSFNLLASAALAMAARSTQPVTFALAATANLIEQAQARVDVVTNLSASAKLLLNAQATMAVETAMRVDAKARLAAYAGAMVELSMDARVVALSSMSSIATAEFDLIARASLTMPVLAEMGASFDLLADALVKFISPIQWITHIDGAANVSQTIHGVAVRSDGIDGVARRINKL